MSVAIHTACEISTIFETLLVSPRQASSLGLSQVLPSIMRECKGFAVTWTIYMRRSGNQRKVSYPSCVSTCRYLSIGDNNR